MKPWKIGLIVLGCLVVLGGYFGYSQYSENKTEKTMKVASKEGSDKGITSDTVAQFTEEEEAKKYKDVGQFIQDFHGKYNDTLGWGRINSIDWTEQKEISNEILKTMKNVQTDNEDLAKDFESIADYANEVVAGKKNQKTLQNLHRYFHDLDIEFNGYNGTDDYFDVTTFKSN
ncbi:hypothetical protein M3182_20320 [Mesobacillus maritimus]|uniref:hypothetical protein n=1 Tax=Mesobacillus maritimus TaxID=1643336 RepID=UPI002041767E|nr:hypothetical protein [Mesobacillus maritimus]MCM3588052.1 hypothetical protein [Mesobacillus maritimus]MCM3668383.1 hypothetical protein [Mesobacillus maritimus]